MNKKFCDICSKEMDLQLDRIGYIDFGFKSKGLAGMLGGQSKKGEICENCIKELNEYIKSKKK